MITGFIQRKNDCKAWQVRAFGFSSGIFANTLIPLLPEWFFYAQNSKIMELNTTNPHCFTYHTEELLIELLGGVRVDGLDRMRVTMKVTVTNRKHQWKIRSN